MWLIFTSVCCLLVLSLITSLAECKDLSDLYRLKDNSTFEVTRNHITYYDMELNQISTSKAESINKSNKFGYQNLTFQGLLCYADSAVDFVQNCRPLIFDDQTVSMNNEKVYEGIFWLIQSQTYEDIVYTEENSPKSSPDSIFDRSSLRIPFDSQYYMLYIAQTSTFVHDPEELEEYLRSRKSMKFKVESIPRYTGDSMWYVKAHHELTYDCTQMHNLQYLSVLLGIVYAVLGVLWVIGLLTSCNSSHIMHRMLVLPPIFKIVECVTYYMLSNECPWTSYPYFSYLILNRMFICLVSECIIVGTCFLFSFGLKIAKNKLSKQDTSILMTTITVNYIFLFFSSITQIYHSIHYLLVAFMFMVYVCVILRNISQCIKSLKQLKRLVFHENVHEVIDNKINTMTSISIVIVFYMVMRGINSVCQVAFTFDETSSVIISIQMCILIQEISTILLLVCLMVMFCPQDNGRIYDLIDIDIIQYLDTDVTMPQKQKSAKFKICTVHMDMKHDATKYHGIKRGQPIIIMNPEDDLDELDSKSNSLRRLSIGIRYKPKSKKFKRR